MSVSDNNKNRGAHGDSSSMLGWLRPSSENPPALAVGSVNEDAYMPICLSMLDAADAIYMLRGWENSDGAKLEKSYAEYQGKTVYYEKGD